MHFHYFGSSQHGSGCDINFVATPTQESILGISCNCTFKWYLDILIGIDYIFAHIAQQADDAFSPAPISVGIKNLAFVARNFTKVKQTILTVRN